MGDAGKVAGAMLLPVLAVGVSTLIVGYTTIKNSVPIYNFYKAMFGEKYINTTYMAVGVVLLFILFQYINTVICGPKIYKREDENEVAVWDGNSRFICGSTLDHLSMIRYISFILLLITGYYLYRNKQIKLTENKLLVFSAIVFAMIVIIP